MSSTPLLSLAIWLPVSSRCYGALALACAALEPRLPNAKMVVSTTTTTGMGAAAVFLLVFVSTFPLAVPFIFIQEISIALRVSNAIAVVLLFGAGYAFGRLTGRHPVWMGSAMVVLGSMLVGLTMALGG